MDDKIINDIYHSIQTHKISRGLFRSSEHNAFSKTDFVKLLLTKYPKKFTNDEDVTKFGCDLVKRNIIVPVTKSKCPSSKFFQNCKEFKFHIKEIVVKSMKVLNSTDICTESKVENPEELAQDIKFSMMKIKANHITGKKVNHEEIAKSNEFADFTKATTRLQRVDVSKMSNNERKAFFINVYNGLVIHGQIALGFGKNVISRTIFFAKTAYLIGEHVYSLNDIEHGILRGNAHPPYSLFRQWKKNDPRIKFACKRDGRIHFSLNCGSIGCPPIRVYSTNDIEDELEIATSAFIMTEVKIVNENKVSLSQIFKWYSFDFGKNDKEKLEWISKFEDDEKRKKIILNPKTKITYHAYDWGHNGSH